MSSHRIPCSWTYTSEDVRSMIYWFEMVRIHAKAVTAQMIQF